MYESDLDEGTCGYGEDGKIGTIPAGPHLNEDDKINLNVSNANDIADEEEAHSGVLELRNKLKENLKNRLK